MQIEPKATPIEISFAESGPATRQGTSTIELTGGKLVLACDVNGHLSWTPRIAELERVIRSPRQRHRNRRIRLVLKKMQMESSWNLIAPYRAVFEELRIEGTPQ